jgi:hypothetical protein
VPYRSVSRDLLYWSGCVHVSHRVRSALSISRAVPYPSIACAWYTLPSMDEFAGLPADSAEPIPTRLRILAAAENLGVLRSVHRPTSLLTKIQFRGGRIYLYGEGFVLGLAEGGSLRLFRWGQFTVKKAGGGYLITGADRRSMGLSRGWSDFAELEQAITTGAHQPQ